MKNGLAIVVMLCSIGISAVAQAELTLDEMQRECGPYFMQMREARAAGRLDDPGLIFMHYLCGQPELLGKMSADEQRALHDFDAEVATSKAARRARMTPEEAADAERSMREIYHAMLANSCQPPDQADADREIRKLWESMRSALAMSNIEQALECFHEHSRDEYRRTFERLRTRLPDLAAELGEPSDGQVGGNLALYRLYREEDERRYSFDLRLALDENCRWKIVSY